MRCGVIHYHDTFHLAFVFIYSFSLWLVGKKCYWQSYKKCFVEKARRYMAVRKAGRQESVKSY